VWVRLRVPEVKSRKLSDEVLAALRDQVLAASPSTLESDNAAAHVIDRKRLLIAEAAEARKPAQESEEPNSSGLRHREEGDVRTLRRRYDDPGSKAGERAVP
jgi:hypothetical protein